MLSDEDLILRKPQLPDVVTLLEVSLRKRSQFIIDVVLSMTYLSEELDRLWFQTQTSLLRNKIDDVTNLSTNLMTARQVEAIIIEALLPGLDTHLLHTQHLVETREPSKGFNKQKGNTCG